MGQINILNDAGTAKLSLQFTGTTNKSLDTGNLSNGVILQTGGSPTSINNGLIVDYESDTTTLTGGGTAIVLRGKSSGGNIANYDQARIRSYGQDTNNAHGFAIDIKPNAATPLLEVFNINTNGVVKMPYQPAFVAHGDNGYWFTSTGVVPFNSTDLNIGGHYSTSNSRFTAPISGTYQFSWSMLCRANANEGHVSIRVNGLPKFETGHFQTNTDDYEYVGGATYFSLNSGDYVDMYVSSVFDGIYMGSNQGYYSQFSGHLIG